MNVHLAREIEVVCLMTSSRHSFISSSLIREVASLGGDVDGLVPDHVRDALRAKIEGGRLRQQNVKPYASRVVRPPGFRLTP